MKLISCVLSLFLAITSCATKVIVNYATEGETLQTASSNESFIIFEEAPIDFTKEKLLGTVQVKDNMSLNCDFETVKLLAKEEAQKMGGNCLLITTHKLPDITSTCHRITAKVYRIDKPKQYEKEIIWSPNRKLEIADFKGSLEKRPFAAATYSGFRYFINAKPFARCFDFKVETYFDCQLSYFKPSLQDSSVLKHEQLHFDISEIYARKYLLRIQQEVQSYNELLKRHEDIVKEVWAAMAIKQDEYDSEVYADPDLQSKWEQWVSVQLTATKLQSSKEIKLPVRQR